MSLFLDENMDFFTRAPGQSISIYPQPGYKPRTPIEQVFAKGPIQAQVLGVQELQVRLGVDAPAELCVVREELRQVRGESAIGGTPAISAQAKNIDVY